MTSERDAAVAAAEWLLTAEAVRSRSKALSDRVEAGASAFFGLDLDRLDDAAERVAALTRSRFPDLRVPLHARWRHFEVGGLDRWGDLARARGWDDPRAAARAAADLAIVSVLMDAGAGTRWQYEEGATGAVFARSEGLAVAGVAMFASGLFSADPMDPLRVDASALELLSEEEFATALQVREDNPLPGLSGRQALLCALAAVLRNRPEVFACEEDEPRPGGLIDYLAAQASGGRLPAARILEVVLDALGPIWPGRIVLAGVPLGDAWRHPDLGRGEPFGNIVPFHKLSSWLSYSLIEPLQGLGVDVVEIDGLTGLAEYRNGGLFVDAGVIVPRETVSLAQAYPPDHPLVVEWRALTVTLLDRLAERVRALLGLSAAALPLAAVLEGGSWLAGRQIAQERRADGGPPIAIASDGTVF